MPTKIDSNLTGLRYAEEQTLGVLPGSPVWNPLEPNAYTDFGGQVATVARSPINASRQRIKGVAVDLDVAAGFATDVTVENLKDLLQGFFFASWDKTDEVTVLTGVDGTSEQYKRGSGLGVFEVGALVLATGFTNSANNGLKRVTTSTATATTVAENLVTETPPATAQLKQVGVQATSADINVDATTDPTKPALTSTTLNFTTLGLSAGDWVRVGGDAASTHFVTAANNGFARVYSVAAQRLTFDNTQAIMVTETGTGLTIQLFIPDILKNQDLPANIVRRSYQFERFLDVAGYEYVIGAVSNQLTFNFGLADKLTADLTFVATDHDTEASPKSGTRPALTSSDAYNTTSHIGFFRVLQGSTSLAGFLMEASLVINNGVTPVKALGSFGAIDATAGDFVVSGSVTAYFTDVATIQAVRDNVDVSVDLLLVRDNAGMLFDIPLLALGDGRLAVEKDRPITIPLELNGARHPVLGHTLLVSKFAYLPDAAE